MADFRFKAKTWVFGNDIDTDQIIPGRFLTATASFVFSSTQLSINSRLNTPPAIR